MIAWSFIKCAPAQRDILWNAGLSDKIDVEFLRRKAKTRTHVRLAKYSTRDAEAKMALILAWYCRAPWTDAELAELLDEVYPVVGLSRVFKHLFIKEVTLVDDILISLGEPAAQVVAKRAKRLAKADVFGQVRND